MALKAVVLFFASYCACVSAVPAQDDFSLPAPAGTPMAALDLWATHYYVHRAAEVMSGIPFRNNKGEPLTGNVSLRDWCSGAIEGTIQVATKDAMKTLNYGGIKGASQVNCAEVLKINPLKKPWISSVGRSYFSAAIGPFGDGVAGYVLVPYRTIAVDKARIPYGSVLFVPEAKGVKLALASGETVEHDGYFFAADTGGAIKGAHIDVFCGVSAANCFPSLISSDESRTFKAWIVDDATIAARLRAMHRP